MKCWVIAAIGVAWAGGSVPASGQGLEGYFYVEPQLLPDSLLEGGSSDRFFILVDRRADTDFERELIRRAERSRGITTAGRFAHSDSHIRGESSSTRKAM